MAGGCRTGKELSRQTGSSFCGTTQGGRKGLPGRCAAAMGPPDLCMQRSFDPILLDPMVERSQTDPDIPGGPSLSLYGVPISF